MAYKCVFAPDSSSYTVTDGTEIVRVELDGGRGRYRRDILNSTRLVTVRWILDREQYEYIRSFYKVAVAQASAPFKIDLILDKATLTEHDAYFIPNTMKLDSQIGLSYTVSAQLEVVPLESDIYTDSALIALWQEFKSDWPYWVDLLDESVNVDWPGAL